MDADDGYSRTINEKNDEAQYGGNFLIFRAKSGLEFHSLESVYNRKRWPPVL